MPVQILQRVLRDDARRPEIRLLQDDLQDQIDAREAVLKHRRHKYIVHQRKALNDFPVARTPRFLCIKHRSPPVIILSYSPWDCQQNSLKIFLPQNPLPPRKYKAFQKIRTFDPCYL